MNILEIALQAGLNRDPDDRVWCSLCWGSSLSMMLAGTLLLLLAP